MKKYDIHSHILPEIDDGAADIDISLLLLEALECQGVTSLAFTPHFYTQYEEVESRLEEFLYKREKSFKKIQKEYAGNMEFTLGAEVHLSENLMLIENPRALCYENTDYMLIEMPYHSKFTDEEMEILLYLKEKHNITPVLAHIERYPALIKNKALISKLKDMGCVMQINTESLTRRFGKGKILKLIKEGYVTVLGSDTHSTTRGCDFGIGFPAIEQHCSESVIENISKASKALFAE
ncbi:MAG: CpsB/CapC family capsule biosynthesis tyrosine phosphatase [Acutalibacteraceae bacterium]|nr:CpsB/CapC family capsule biosynthesis tyrosine phosphatase [Acutalibacteraceae bacterium]